MNKGYTILLSVPSEIADDSTPWQGTYLWTGRATSVDAAITTAQRTAAGDHEYDGEPADGYAVLFVCYGEHDDITPEAHQ